MQESFKQAGVPRSRHPAPLRQPQPAGSLTTQGIREKYEKACSNKPNLLDAVKQLTPEELEDLWADTENPQQRDCIYSMHCNVGDSVGVLVEDQPNMRRWGIGRVVAVDLVAQAATFRFPGRVLCTHNYLSLRLTLHSCFTDTYISTWMAC